MTFSHFVLYVLLAVGVLLGFRLVIWLSGFSCRIVMVLTRLGMHSAAKTVLQLVAYDRSTYLKSRSVYWNQVGVRFMLFWGTQAVLVAFLLLLWAGNKIHAIGPYWMGCLMVYIIYRCLATLWNDEESEDQRVEQNFNSTSESAKNTFYVRQWNFLDELFRVG